MSRKKIASTLVARAKDLQVHFSRSDVASFIEKTSFPGAVVFGRASFLKDSDFFNFLQSANLKDYSIEVLADSQAHPISATVIRKKDAAVFYLRDIERIIPAKALDELNDDWIKAAEIFKKQIRKIPGGEGWDYNLSSTASGLAAKVLENAVTFETMRRMSTPAYLRPALRDSYAGGLSISPDDLSILEDGYALDFKACYPTLIEEHLRAGTLPTGQPRVIRHKIPKNSGIWESNTLYLISAKIPENTFSILYRKTLVGNFRTAGKVQGWYWGKEIEAQEKLGLEEIKIHQEIIYLKYTNFQQTEHTIADFFSALREMRKESAAAKLVANSLIGRFAQKEGGAGRTIVKSEFALKDTYPVPELGQNWFQLKKTIMKNPYSLVQVASFITSAARVQLIESVKNPLEIIYSDTDSIWLNDLNNLSEKGNLFVENKKIEIKKIKEAVFLGGKRYFYRENKNKNWTQITAGISEIKEINNQSLNILIKKLNSGIITENFSKKITVDGRTKIIKRTLSVNKREEMRGLNAPVQGLKDLLIKEKKEIQEINITEVEKEKEAIEILNKLFK